MLVHYETICPFCGAVHFIDIPLDRLFLWQSGMKVQDAFPDLSADDRERLISGICPDCWEKMFGDDSDEPDLPPLPPDEEEWYDTDWYAPTTDVLLPYDEMGFDPFMGCYSGDC